MAKKLLVITAGTVAAGVGQEILKQMRAHSKSELHVMVRNIDTAYLPNRYPKLRPGEWFQMSIEPGYMEAIHKNLSKYPPMERMLFPGLLPGTDVAGGGSIRYNGAGAVEIQRENLRKWLSTSMAELASSGDGDTNVSMALIISAVGATGSGSLEHLIDVIVDAAHYANIKSTAQSTIRCDLYIMQPGIQEVTDLGLANTLALYAELAASQLSLKNTNARQYQGRKIMIGWGSNRALANIEQLKDAAATLIRLSTDPSSAFAAEFQEREVDNHVLRELDPISNLPTHLSLATVVTISLGRLEELVIQRDVARLVEDLVFGKIATSKPTNIFFTKLAKALAGERAEDRYKKLLDYLSEGVDLNAKRIRLAGTAANKSLPAREKASRLQSLWLEYKEEIKQSRSKIQDYGRHFVDETIAELERSKYELVVKGSSLAELREEYRLLENTITATLTEALKDTQTTVDDSAIARQEAAFNRSWFFNRKTRLRNLMSAMQRNLEAHLQATARDIALENLEDLQTYCAEVGQKLDIVLEKLRKQRDEQEGWAAAYRPFRLETGHPLQIIALSTPDEINKYAEKVSIFSTRSRGRSSMLPSRNQGNDQLADFRQWLKGKEEFEALFKGNVPLLSNVATTYTSEKVHEAMRGQKVVDILLQAGEETLNQRLKEAVTRASSLVSYSKSFAPDRREAWHLSVDYGENEPGYKSQETRETVYNAMIETFVQGQPKLLSSNDPTEIAIFYYVDGIPMSAVDDLKGRCLEAFLKRRQQWLRQQASLNGNGPVASIGSVNQRVGVPIYSGKDAEERVIDTCVIQRLYGVKGVEVGDYKVEDVPELGCKPNPSSIAAELVDLSEQPAPHTNGNKPMSETSSTPSSNGIHTTSQESITKSSNSNGIDTPVRSRPMRPRRTKRLNPPDQMGN